MKPLPPVAPPKMRILMLGASGKLGRMMRAVWPEVLGQQIDLIPVSRKQSDSGTSLVWAPGQDAAHLPQADAVFAAWGVTAGDEAQHLMNSTLADEAARVARSVGAGCVLHCSSAAVYRPGPSLLTENAPTDPPGAYGLSKLHMEQRIAQMGGDLRHVILRIGSIAGAESLFGNMRPGGAITLDQFADGQGPARSYIAPQDLAQVVAALARDGAAQGAYNIAAPKPVRMQDLAHQAGCSITWRPAPSTALQTVTLDTARLTTVCALGPQASDPAHLVDGARATGVWP